MFNYPCGLSGFTNVIAMYDAKLMRAESIIKTSDAEVDRLQSENVVFTEVEQARLALQDEVVILRGECALLPCLPAEVGDLNS